MSDFQRRDDFIPYNVPDITDAEINEVVETLKSGWVAKGPRTNRFEQEFAGYLGAKHAVAMNSCTAALHIALLAKGIGPGDEVITTGFDVSAQIHPVEVTYEAARTKAVLEVLPDLDWKPDVINCNDWQTALVPVYYNLMFASRPFYENIKTVFTIHNIQYQGRYGREILEYVLGIDDAHFRSGFMAMDGDVNLMKAAIVASTAVTTVSPSYAEEIQTEYYGYRLDSVLRMNSYKLHGILNGIDMDAFNPQTDTKIFKQYGPKTPEDKLVNKTELLKLCGLEGDANTPVIGIVTRFVDQKGLDLVEAVLPDILSDDVRLVVLGTGDWKYEQMFIEAKRRWPDKVSASIMFSGDLANRIYAGADMFLMPSKFEPCGLAQMIALRYGNIPIVRETGGLKDSIHDMGGDNGNGFTFKTYNAHDMLGAIQRAEGLYGNKPLWNQAMVNAMNSDFSWNKSANEYVDMYKRIMKD